MIWFLYRAIWINGGGQIPETRVLPETVKLGIAEHDGLYLGCAEKIEDLWHMRPWLETIISEDEANGFRLLGTDVIDEGDIDNPKPRSLTSTEKALKLKMASKLYSMKRQLPHRNRLEAIEKDVPAIQKNIGVAEQK